MLVPSPMPNPTSSLGESMLSRRTNQKGNPPKIASLLAIVNAPNDTLKNSDSKNLISNMKTNSIHGNTGKGSFAMKNTQLKVEGDLTTGGKGSSSFKGNVYKSNPFYLMQKQKAKRSDCNVTPRRPDNKAERDNSKFANSRTTNNSFNITNLSKLGKSPGERSSRTKLNMARVFRQPKVGFSPITYSSKNTRTTSANVSKNHSVHNQFNDSNQSINTSEFFTSLAAKVGNKSRMGANIDLLPKSTTPYQTSRDHSRNNKNFHTSGSTPQSIPNTSKSPNRLSQNKNRLDKLQMNQKGGFKLNGPSPVMFYVKKVPATKLPVSRSIKVKAAQKNVITGVLQNSIQSGNSSHDASTNTTYISKMENKETGNTIISDKEKTTNVQLISSRPQNHEREKEKDIELLAQIPLKFKEKEEGNVENHSARVNKHTEKRGEADFRQITTSPLVRKKQSETPKTNMDATNKQEGNPITSVNINLVSAVSNERSAPGIDSMHEMNHYPAVANKCFVVKKNIKLMHQFTKIGYAGEGIKKVNQDNYFIFQNFVGNPNHIFMGVCDGHGIVGHEVSGYLTENLPLSLNNALKYKNMNIQVNPIHEIIQDVFSNINFKLISNEMIDSNFSGSTCASLIYTSEKLICANVGDSRAVLGKYSNGQWLTHNLSRDHKPIELDEASRVIQNDGRIEPFRDEDNEFIGPPRVWLKEDDVPGLAMTRSFGDRVAATVGVISEPEITVYEFKEEDKFFIVASDGIWEFIESNECVNIIKEYYLKNDIVGCCEELHREASIRWMKEEEVIDDITMIVIFLE